MQLSNQIHDILIVLLKNLQQSSPQLVPSSRIAQQLQMKPADIRPILQVMKGTGLIESDPDLQYNLITQEGLAKIFEHNPLLVSPVFPFMQENEAAGNHFISHYEQSL